MLVGGGDGAGVDEGVDAVDYELVAAEAEHCCACAVEGGELGDVVEGEVGG